MIEQQSAAYDAPAVQRLADAEERRLIKASNKPGWFGLMLEEVERIKTDAYAAGREDAAQAIECDASEPRKGSLNHRAYAGHFAAIARARVIPPAETGGAS